MCFDIGTWKETALPFPSVVCIFVRPDFKLAAKSTFRSWEVVDVSPPREGAVRSVRSDGAFRGKVRALLLGNPRPLGATKLSFNLI